MSYILDALRKAERQRLNTAPSGASKPSSPSNPNRARPFWPIATLLLVNTLILTVLVYFVSMPTESASPVKLESAAGVEHANVPSTTPRADLSARAAQVQIDVHVFGETPSQRFVVIDGRRFREGDALEVGLWLREITSTGFKIGDNETTVSIDFND